MSNNTSDDDEIHIGRSEILGATSATNNQDFRATPSLASTVGQEIQNAQQPNNNNIQPILADGQDSFSMAPLLSLPSSPPETVRNRNSQLQPDARYHRFASLSLTGGANSSARSNNHFRERSLLASTVRQDTPSLQRPRHNNTQFDPTNRHRNSSMLQVSNPLGAPSYSASSARHRPIDSHVQSHARTNRFAHSPPVCSAPSAAAVTTSPATSLRSSSSSGATSLPPGVSGPPLNESIYSVTANSPATPTGQPPVPGPGGIRDSQGRTLSLQELGIFHTRAKRPDYAVLSTREETFNGWPQDSPVHFQELARAGMTYMGYGHITRCFFCECSFGAWKATDNAFVEHARWSPDCGFVRRVMSNSFVDAVQARVHRNEEDISYEDVMADLRRTGGNLENILEEEPLAESLAIRLLINEGFSEPLVKQAAEKLRDEGAAINTETLYRQVNQVPPTDGAVGDDASSTQVPGSTSAPLDDGLTGIRDQNWTLINYLTCKVCMDREVKVVFLPCGHLVCCQECSTAMRDCPLCRGPIRASVVASLHSKPS